MRFEPLRQRFPSRDAAAVRRLSAEGHSWRVLVEAWPAGQGWQGRLVFEPHEPVAPGEPRRGPPALRGATRAAVVSSAHEVTERQLRRLLRSLV